MMLRLLTLCLLATSVTGCASLGLSTPTWPGGSTASSTPGTPDWWKSQRKNATFVPGKGYQVAEVEGYFDQEGRPIRSRVAKRVKPQEGGLLADMKLSGAVAEMKSQVGMGPDEQMARDAYTEGEALFRAENYQAAAQQFKQTVARWPGTQLEQDAMFQLAESYFFAEKYPKANDAYEALLQKHANTQHLDKVIRRQFDLARYWEQHHQYDPHWAVTPNLIDRRRPLFDTLGRALKNYENIRLNDPTGPLADDAIMATANSYFLRGRYNDADYHYGLLRREYPRSEHQFEAHVLGLQSKLRAYQGPDYGGGKLEEARKLSKQLKSQFAGKLDADQRNRLQEIEGTIDLQLASFEMEMGKYYENKSENRSAKTYYARVMNDFPNTDLAATARQRVAALAGQPDRPEEMLSSVIDWFPQSAERKSIAQVPLIQDSPSLEGAPQHQIATRPEQSEGSGNDEPIQR